MSGFTHTPYDGSATPFTMGLAPCPPARWIEPDERLATHLAQKDRLLSTQTDAVYRVLPGMDEACADLLHVLAAHLQDTFPDLYSVTAETITIHPLGQTFGFADFVTEPLALAARLVQEDLCLIRPLADGTHELAAAALCFPSSWALADKIGKPLAAVHAPVPGYETDLGPRIDRLFTRLPHEQILWRMNWSLDEGEALHRPRPHSHDAWLEAGGDPLDHLHIRTERQTVRRLPETGVVLFTIKIGLDPLARLAEHPQARHLARGMHDQLAAMTPAQSAYKGLTRARPAILATLAAIADGKIG